MEIMTVPVFNFVVEAAVGDVVEQNLKLADDNEKILKEKTLSLYHLPSSTINESQ